MGVTRPAAHRAVQAVLVIAVMLGVGCLATGCSHSGRVKAAISSFTAGKSIKPAKPQVTASAAVPSATAAPSAQPPAAPTVAPQHAASAGAAASGQSSSAVQWWLVAVAVALVVLLTVLIAWTARRSRRRTTVTATWRSRAADAYAQGEALQDAISVAEVPGAFAAGEAAARWSDIERRADGFAQTLYGLREAAPDDDARAVVSNVLASLQAVRSALIAERASGGAGGYGAATVRDRLSFLETSLRELREAQLGIR